MFVVKRKYLFFPLFTVIITGLIINMVYSAQVWPEQIPADSGIVALRYYVSPTGSDTNDGSLSKPFATLEKARTIAKSKIATAPGNIDVIFRGGEYAVTQTILFDTSDSAPNGKKITYKAYEGESPVFTGKLDVKNWVQYSGNIWRARISSAYDFRQIYINSQKGVRARKPNAGEYYRLENEKTATGFLIQKGAINTANFKSGMEMAVKNIWMHKRLRISSAVDETSYTNVTINPLEWNDLLTKPQGSLIYYNAEYWLENAYEFMDTNNEWYYDKSIGYLYLMSAVNPNTLSVSIPRNESIITLNGGLGSPVSNLSFEGLTFKHTNWSRPNDYGLNDIQGNTIIPTPENYKTDAQFRYGFEKEYIPAAFTAKAAFNITVKNCTFTNLGGTGISFKNGGAHISITQNVFSQCANTAIEVGEDRYRPSDDRYRFYNVNINNNLIENIATEYFGGIGILVFYVNKLNVEHNEIFNVPYSGINVGWGWGKTEYVEEAKDYTVRYNRVERFCEELKDGGGIYAPNPVYGTSVIDNNYVVGSERAMRTGSMIGGIYHDAYGRNWSDSNNVIDCVMDWAVGQASGTDRYAGRNINLNNNYVTVKRAKALLDGEFVIYTNTHLVDGAQLLPQEAQDIIALSGIETQYETIRNRLSKSISCYPAVYQSYPEKYNEIAINTTNTDITINVQLPAGFVNKGLKQAAGGYVLSYYILPLTKAEIYKGYIIAYQNGIEIARTKIEFIVKDYEKGIYVNVNGSGYSETGTWKASSLSGFSTLSRYGYSDAATATFTTPLDSGRYKVSVYRVSNESSSKQIQISVQHKNGTSVVYMDGTVTPAGWVDLGTYDFGTVGTVIMKKIESGYVRTSDVRFEKIDIIVTDSNGADIEKLIQNTRVNAKLNVVNKTSEPMDTILIACLYNADGILAQTTVSPLTVAPNNSGNNIMSINLPNQSLENYMLKIFAWNTKEGMKPLYMPRYIIN